eukprot:s1286_g1.t1
MGVEECVEVAEVIGTKMVPAWFILNHTDSPPAKFTVTGLAWLHSSGGFVPATFAAALRRDSNVQTGPLLADPWLVFAALVEEDVVEAPRGIVYIKVLFQRLLLKSLKRTAESHPECAEEHCCCFSLRSTHPKVHPTDLSMDWDGLVQTTFLVEPLVLFEVGILAREVMALLGTHDAPRSLEDSQDVQPVSEKYVDDITQEPVWDKTPVCLREGGILSWVRPSSERPTLQERNEERSPTLDAQRLGEVGPLRGSSVEYMGPQRSPQTPGGSDPEGSLYVFRIFPTHNLRRQPLTFAAESLADAELWIAKLQAGMAPPRPPPPAARRCARLVEFWEAKGPPLDAEPPPAWLRLEVLRTAGLVASSEAGEARNSAGSLQAEGGPAPFASVAGTHNLYVLGRVHSSYFRTATRYGVDCSGVTQFGHCFELPLVLENPDEHVELMVYHEPEYDDSEPVLLGGICVPLFAFRRGKRLCLQLPLKQDDATRRGLVNVAFGHLTIAVYVDQPLGG